MAFSFSALREFLVSAITPADALSSTCMESELVACAIIRLNFTAHMQLHDDMLCVTVSG